MPWRERSWSGIEFLGYGMNVLAAPAVIIFWFVQTGQRGQEEEMDVKSGWLVRALRQWALLYD